MRFRFKDRCRCQWVQYSNGIVKALFAPMSSINDMATPEILLLNMRKERGEFEQGKEYLIEINPAFPH